MTWRVYAYSGALSTSLPLYCIHYVASWLISESDLAFSRHVLITVLVRVGTASRSCTRENPTCVKRLEITNGAGVVIAYGKLVL